MPIFFFLFASVIFKIIGVHFMSQITMVAHAHVGWLDCPSSGQEICCMIPSKVPLGESFNDCIPPGKRYSFKQVIHQQRVLGRKVSRIYSENVILHLDFCISAFCSYLSLNFLQFLFFKSRTNLNERNFQIFSKKEKKKKRIPISCCLSVTISVACPQQNNLENLNVLFHTKRLFA